MKDFLDKLASDSPTPGGGSASAASGAIGAALLSMVYSISRKKIINSLNNLKKKKSIEPKDLLREQETQNILVEKFSKAEDEVKRVMNKLLLLVDEDAKAYESVLRKIGELKKVKVDSNKSKIDRNKIKIDYSKVEIDNKELEINYYKAKESVQKAYKYAAEVPFKMAKLCYEILKASEKLSNKIYSSVKSDCQIAILLLKTAIKGALLNVNLNLNEIDDKNFVKEKRKELNKILKYLD